MKNIGDYKGLWYKVSGETIDLTVGFYEEKLKGSKVLTYYAQLFNTNKFEAYIKKEISLQIFAVLKDLHLIRLSHPEDSDILLSKNPINEYIIAYIEHKYKIKYNVRWVLSRWQFFFLFVYYGWLFIEFIKRGIVFNKKRKNYKLSMEAAWGFRDTTLRNDVLIDNKRFRTKDILMLKLGKTIHPQRIRAFKEAKEKGFDTVSLSKLKININKNISALLFRICLT